MTESHVVLVSVLRKCMCDMLPEVLYSTGGGRASQSYIAKFSILATTFVREWNVTILRGVFTTAGLSKTALLKRQKNKCTHHFDFCALTEDMLAKPSFTRPVSVYHNNRRQALLDAVEI